MRGFSCRAVEIQGAGVNVILMPGGSGAINAGANGGIEGAHRQSGRLTRSAYAGRGLAVLVVDAGVNLASAVQFMAAMNRPVTVIATSRGTLRAARGIAGGAGPTHWC